MACGNFDLSLCSLTSPPNFSLLLELTLCGSVKTLVGLALQWIYKSIMGFMLITLSVQCKTLIKIICFGAGWG